MNEKYVMVYAQLWVWRWRGACLHEAPTKNEKSANGSVGARVRLMVRGGCLPVRGYKGMEWKYDDDLCVCGIKDT